MVAWRVEPRAVGTAGRRPGPGKRSRAGAVQPERVAELLGLGAGLRGGTRGAGGVRAGAGVLRLCLHLHARPRPQHSVTLVPAETFTPEFVEPRVHCVSSHGAFSPSR